MTKASPSSDTGVWGFSRWLLRPCVEFRVPGEGFTAEQSEGDQDKAVCNLLFSLQGTLAGFEASPPTDC